LLTRHRIQCEACADFRDAAGSLGDHDKIDDHQNKEHHQANGIVATNQELSKCFDHLARSVRTCVAMKQHHPGGRDIEGQAQQCCEQQDGRKYSEIQWLERVQADQEDDDRDRDVEGKKQIQQEGRHWQDHHREDHDDQHRDCRRTQSRGSEQPFQVVRGVHFASSRSLIAGSRSAAGPGSSPKGMSGSSGACGAGPPWSRCRRN